MANGFVVVDKPPGWTSHDVVARCRKLLGERRVGHAGTLDPDATGVLIVAAGRATRLLRFLAGLPKHYEGELVLGEATTTLDASGEVTGRWDMSGLSVESVRKAAALLTGDLMQVPPMVSAVQVGGRRLHELARQGIEVERKPRPVRVESFEVEPTDEAGVYRFRVECSSGTYIRSLVADLGASLGGGAHLRRLRRTAVGAFSVAESVALDEVSVDGLLSPAQALGFLPRRLVEGEELAAVRYGRRLPPSDGESDRSASSVPLTDGESDRSASRGGLTEGESDQPATAAALAGESGEHGDAAPLAVVDAEGALVAVYERCEGGWRAAVVLDPA